MKRSGRSVFRRRRRLRRQAKNVSPASDAIVIQLRVSPVKSYRGEQALVTSRRSLVITIPLVLLSSSTNNHSGNHSHERQARVLPSIHAMCGWQGDQYICPEGAALKQFRRNYSDPNRGPTNTGRTKYRGLKLICQVSRRWGQASSSRGAGAGECSSGVTV